MSQVAKKSAMKTWLIRLCGSVLFLGLLFYLFPAEAFWTALRAIPWFIFVSVFGLFLCAHVIAALKLWWLLDCAVPSLSVIRAHFAGLAANLGLPGAIGGDAVRAALIQSQLKDGARVVAVAATDRLIDMFALLTLAAIGAALTVGQGVGFSAILQAGAILGLVVLGLFLAPSLADMLWRRFPGLPGKSFVEKLLAALRGLTQNPLRLVGVFVLSTAIQTGLVLMAYWLAATAGAGIALAPWLFAWPLAKLIAVLPVSINGLGLREASLAGLLTPFGADGAAIVASGLVWQMVLFAAGALGGIILLLTRKKGA